MDVAIIGAGPAGLAAGYLLSKAGRRVAIIERDATHIGGLSRAVEHGGYRFDFGDHGFSTNSQAVIDLWNEILPEGFVERPRVSRVWYEGRLYSHPLRAIEVLRGFGIWRAGLCFASYLRARALPARDVRTFADWASRQFGRRLYLDFFKGYAEKRWGISCEELSAGLAAQHLQARSFARAASARVSRWLGPKKPPVEGQGVETSTGFFRYPRPGPGTMWEAARDKIGAAGGQVIMGCGLKQLASDGQGGWRMTAVGPEGERVVLAAHAISSAPIRELAARLYPLPLSTIEASQLKYRDLLVVALMIRPDAAFTDDCIFIHDDRLQVGRVRNYRSSSPDLAPDDGAACVGLEYSCSEGDDLWSMGDAELLELATREMAILGLVSSDKVMDGAVVRLEKAYPLYDEGYAANVAAMRAEVETRHPTLHLVGRNGMHREHDIGRAMLTAMQTVENILAGERVHDAWRVEDREYSNAVDGRAGTAIADRAAGRLQERTDARQVAASRRKAA